MEIKSANPVKPAKMVSIRGEYASGTMHSQGPTCHFAWNDATPAKQHIARKLKNICDAKKMFRMSVLKSWTVLSVVMILGDKRYKSGDRANEGQPTR